MRMEYYMKFGFVIISVHQGKNSSHNALLLLIKQKSVNSHWILNTKTISD
jgi:hypothetical protein